MKLTLTEIFDKCLEKWGLKSQILMLSEESIELSLEALHLARNRDCLMMFAEEVADTELMLEEIKYFFQKTDLKLYIDNWRAMKIKRLRKTLKEGI